MKPETDLTVRRDMASRLRAETRGLHDAAERHPFQRAFSQGQLPLESYVDYLGQLFLVRRSLESALRRWLAGVPALRAVVREHQFQEPYLRDDLEYFSVMVDRIQPGVATQTLIDRIESVAPSRPVGLLGYHYVLEGSNNGSKFAAESIRRAYGLKRRGTRYLDPYGDQQRSYWAQFKADLASAPVAPSDADFVIGCAGEMFAGIARISDELHVASGNGVSAPGAGS